MQPSESSRSKVTRVGGAQRRVEVGGVDVGVGGEDDEHGGERRGEHAGALGHPADRPAGTLDDRLLGTESVVMIACGGVAPPSPASAAYAASAPASSRSRGR